MLKVPKLGRQDTQTRVMQFERNLEQWGDSDRYLVESGCRFEMMAMKAETPVL